MYVVFSEQLGKIILRIRTGQETSSVETWRWENAKFVEQPDAVSIEEPLEILLTYNEGGELETRPIAVTMRTPGEDVNLAAGFLFTEAIISNRNDVDDIVQYKENLVNVSLKPHIVIDPRLIDRHSFVASSCGVCGKRTIEAVRVKRVFERSVETVGPIATATICTLPQTLRRAQTAFSETGGIHASGLFNLRGELLRVSEDVGRHNALDKLIGAEFLSDKLPLSQHILLVSGRASFELVQKAAQAGICLIAAVGAPSSLAIELAKELDISLLGFVRKNRFNIYSGRERISGLDDKLPS